MEQENGKMSPAEGLIDFLFPHHTPLQVLDKFAFGLFDLDWDVFTQHIEGAINRVPVLENTGIKSTVCGPGEFYLRASTMTQAHWYG